MHIKKNKKVFESSLKNTTLFPLVAGGVFIHLSGFRGYTSETAGATMVKLESFWAAPGHRKLGGPIREASLLGEDHDADLIAFTIFCFEHNFFCFL